LCRVDEASCVPLRAGVHTGEIEVRDQDVGGIAVHAAARVMAQCGANEVLVSRVVTDLVAGAGLKFTERGAFKLKGIPDQWELLAAAPQVRMWLQPRPKYVPYGSGKPLESRIVGLGTWSQKLATTEQSTSHGQSEDSDGRNFATKP